MQRIQSIPNRIRVTVDREPLRLPAQLQERVDDYWLELVRQKPHLIRGGIYSLKTMHDAGSELSITLERTDYAHFAYARHAALDERWKCSVVVANGVVRTSDGCYVLGEMGAETFTPGKLQFIAGGIDRRDVHDDTVDLLGSLSREAQEEMGLDLADSHLVARVIPAYLVEWRSIALICLIELAVDAEAFAAHYERYVQRLRRRGGVPEFSSITFVHAGRIDKFLADDPRPKLDFLPLVLKTIGRDPALNCPP